MSPMNKATGCTRISFLTFIVLFSLNSLAETGVATLRQGISLTSVNPQPAALQNEENSDIKQSRAYPMQPPVIPHKTAHYQTDLNANTCLSCHSRSRTEESQAPMISVTHFMDRDGNFLADVSPRRYFCRQCHVSQVERKPLIKNDFTDIDDILKRQTATKKH